MTAWPAARPHPGRRAAQAATVVVALLAVLLQPAAAGAGVGTREQPHPRGATVAVDGGFTVRVLSTRQGAPTAAGSTVLVTMQATNRSRIANIPFLNGSLGAIGASGTAYSSLAGSCGAIAGDVSAVSPVAPGKTVVVRTCWRVRAADAASLVMVYDPYRGSAKTYFALR